MSNPLDMRNVVYALRVYGSSEIRYVGITTRRLRERMWSHRASARRGAQLPIWDWMRKHGPERIEAIVLEADIKPLARLAELEIQWIDELRNRGVNLLNVSDGGLGMNGVPCTPENRKAVGDRFRGTKVPRERVERGQATKSANGYRHSAETRAKIRETRASRTYNPPRGEANWGFGRKRSEETKAKLRAANLGRKYSPERLEAHLKTRPRGENVNTAKFTQERVEEIITRMFNGEKVGKLAEEFGVARNSIGRIKAGKTWSHIDREGLWKKWSDSPRALRDSH